MIFYHTLQIENEEYSLLRMSKLLPHEVTLYFGNEPTKFPIDLLIVKTYGKDDNQLISRWMIENFRIEKQKLIWKVVYLNSRHEFAD